MDSTTGQSIISPPLLPSLFSFFSRKKKQKRILYFGPALIEYPENLRILARDPFVLPLLEQADAMVLQRLGWSPIQRLKEDRRPDTFVHEDYIVNECLLQLCLFKKWMSQGIEYHLVAAYSLGELAAGHAAGFYSFEQAIHLCCSVVEGLRTPKEADLMTVFASVQEVVKIAGEHGITCYPGIDNHNRSTWTGLIPELNRLQEVLEPLSIKTKRFHLYCASHSPMVDTNLIRRRLEGFQPKAAEFPYFSSVTGGLYEGLSDADYWVRLITGICMANEMNDVLGSQAFDQIIRFGSMRTGLSSILGKMKNTVSIYDTSELLKHS